MLSSPVQRKKAQEITLTRARAPQVSARNLINVYTLVLFHSISLRGSFETTSTPRGRAGDVVPLLHDPAATRGNCNNYAKTERNGALRAKGKKEEDVPRNGAQKEQREPRWWRRWHAKEAS
ncbi:hypothetical protein KM043_009596 [Ampulex compressa]|nr:hypothetical protein KM043_009596 [Ampulex compressa]